MVLLLVPYPLDIVQFMKGSFDFGSSSDIFRSLRVDFGDLRKTLLLNESQVYRNKEHVTRTHRAKLLFLYPRCFVVTVTTLNCWSSHKEFAVNKVKYKFQRGKMIVFFLW